MTVDDYLKGLPDDRREAMTRVRAMVKKNLPKGYREHLDYGMITWDVPLETFSHTYNKKPLCYIGLASQKNHMALYLMSAYGDPQQEQYLADAFRNAGKKLDMGKSCLRFKKLEDLPLDALGKVVASTPPDALIAKHEAAHAPKRAARKK